MEETTITLYVDLKQGSRLDLEAAGNAALAWAKLLKTVGESIDPFGEWQVELDRTLPGSQRIRSVIKVKGDSDRRATIKGAIVAAITFVVLETASWGIGEILDYMKGPDAPVEVQELSETQMQALASEVAEILRNGAGQQEAQAVYDALESDPDVTGAGATSGQNPRPEYVVPRGSFPARRSSASDTEPEERTVVEQMSVILVRPVLSTQTTRRWGFQTRAGSFGAPIHDAEFLADLAAGKLNVPLTQGIVMDVELHITEVLIGGVWRPKDRVVKRVIKITRPAVQVSLFDNLEQDDADQDDA